MIAEQPRHGYELMKAIEDRLGGSYSPSPGVIYPTLSWLEDMGYATVDAEEGGRNDVAVEIERRDCRHYRVFSFTLSGIMLSAPRRP